MLPKSKSADIALLLEGTYPFIRGGVSSWVHAIIKGFPEFRFAVIFLGSEPGAYTGIQYELPKNLVHVETHFLQDTSNRARAPIHTKGPDENVFPDLMAMHESFIAPGGFSHGDPAFAKVVGHLMAGRVDQGHFTHSREAWDMITAMYRQRSTDPSFVDYFWTVRSMHEPIWVLADAARGLIDARCYHSVSTGYAGFLGSIAAKARNRPFILSEHGLYTKERKIDLFHSTWIKEAGSPIGQAQDSGYFRDLWIRFFEVLGKAAYAAADPIVSLYDGIRCRQIEDGAEESRTRCIPNGIEVERFAPLRMKQALPPKPIFALIGRVVPIKDVKTFIRAMHNVCNRISGAEGWVVGPTEENPAYHEECVALCESLGLADKVQFLGYRNVTDVLPDIAILVLSSISEALPLTLLEGFAAGVPAVSTDVGSCRQLIEGLNGVPEDQEIGAAGKVVDIGDPGSLAEAIIELYSNPKEWSRARSAGIARVEKYYTDKRMLNSYADIYRQAMS